MPDVMTDPQPDALAGVVLVLLFAVLLLYVVLLLEGYRSWRWLVR